VDNDAQAASIAIPGEWRVRLLAVANGPNIFQMLLVLKFKIVLCVSTVKIMKDFLTVIFTEL